MKTLATLPEADASHLSEFLKAEGIRCETKTTTDEIGLDVIELLVADDQFEIACDATEKWETARVAAMQKKQGLICPKCASHDCEAVQDEFYAEVELRVFRCKQCAAEFSRM